MKTWIHNAIMDEDGNVTGYGEELVEADSTIISISQVPRTKLVRTTDGLESTEGGAKTVVHAVEGAKTAAYAMMRYMEA